jgi:myo-inositol-1(or 4)-monophosphatase
MLQTAILAAREAGSILVDNLEKPRQTRVKGLRDIVTDADVEAQRAIIEIIQTRFPSHHILSEELDPDSKGQVAVKPTSPTGSGHLDGGRYPDPARCPYTWIVDPLDGTTNYSRRLPCFCTSIALSHQGEVILGVVYDPLLDHLFRAERGKGAYLNSESLQVSPVGSLASALIGMDWARAQAKREVIGPLVARMALQVRTLRTLGAAALGLCYVAAGWLDAYFHFTLRAWDAAAGGLIVQEAGGSASDLAGHPWQINAGHCLVSNGQLHDEMLGILMDGGRG